MKLTLREQTLEEIAAVAVTSDPMVEEALRVYGGLPNRYWLESDIQKRVLHPVLDSAQINQTFNVLLQKEKYGNNLGDYISKLIQTSYDVGHNNFVLHTQDTEINWLGFDLKGTPKNKINLTIHGNVGTYFGFGSENCNFIVNGGVNKNLGFNSIDCTFKTKYELFET